MTMIPTRDAIARPEREIVAQKALKEIPPMELKPSAHTRIRAAIIVFLLLVKSTLFSTTFLIPIAEIMPYSMNEMPPMVAVGMLSIMNATLGTHERIIANTAAILMILGS